MSSKISWQSNIKFQTSFYVFGLKNTFEIVFKPLKHNRKV